MDPDFTTDFPKSMNLVELGERMVDTFFEPLKTAIRILAIDGERYWLEPYFRAAHPNRKPPGYYFQFIPKKTR